MLPFGENTPMPTPSMTVDPNLVTPGFIGFAAVALLVVVVVLLIWDMNRRIRRVRYREEVREELDAEQAAADAARGDSTQPDEPDAQNDDPDARR